VRDFNAGGVLNTNTDEKALFTVHSGLLKSFVTRVSIRSFFQGN
jgi:hypothetical protein